MDEKWTPLILFLTLFIMYFFINLFCTVTYGDITLPFVKLWVHVHPVSCY